MTSPVFRSSAALRAVVGVLALACATLGRTGAQVAPKIAEIVVVGSKNLSSTFISAASGLKVGDAVSQASLDDAKRRLLATQNFGARRLDNPEDAVRIQAAVEGDKAKVTIEVEENDLVKGINITGSGPVPAAVIKSLLQTREGLVLNMGKLSGDADRVQEYYKAKGYEAAVDSPLDVNNGILEFNIVVAKVNKIKVTGLKKTRQIVVLREIRQKPGSYFNYEEVKKDLYRVFNTDLFKDVSPSIQTPTRGKVDINLNVEEKQTGNVSVFVGYSSRNQLVGGAEVGENNLFGLGQQASLRWDTGGIANRSSLEIGFTEPWLDPKHTSLSVNAYDKTVYRFASNIGSASGTSTAQTGDYYEVRTGGQVVLSRPMNENTRAFVGLRYDSVRVPVIPLNAADAVALQNGPLLALNLRATHNTRDLDQEPASGGYEMASLDVGHADLKAVNPANPAPNGVYGSVNYQKLQFDARRYFSPGGPRKNPKDRRSTFAFRLALGMSAGTLPFFEQFFVGGAETLRGYTEDRFWGKNMLMASVEFRHPLAQSLLGVVFVDAGDAWGGPYEKVTFNDLRQHGGFSPSIGLGVGLRVQTPIGPIRIDQGFGREGTRTHFSIGHVF